MTAAIASTEIVPPTPEKTKPISWETFEEEYITREDAYKYEWVNGFVEKTERTINQYQTFIARNLLKFFFQLEFQKKVSGMLMPEADTFFLEKTHRIPDIAYWTEEQLEKIKNKENQIPKFVIEVISQHDKIYKVHEKMDNYWEAGVEVIWHIFPELKVVHVYKGKEMTVCKAEQICSAAPVLPVFELSVAAIFGE